MADRKGEEFWKAGRYFKNAFQVLRVLRFNMISGKNVKVSILKGAETLYSTF